MRSTLQKIARDRRCVALMNLMKRGRNTISRTARNKLVFLRSSSHTHVSEPASGAQPENIFKN